MGKRGRTTVCCVSLRGSIERRDREVVFDFLTEKWVNTSEKVV